MSEMDFEIATADICPHGTSSSLCEWCQAKATVGILRAELERVRGLVEACKWEQAAKAMRHLQDERDAARAEVAHLQRQLNQCGEAHKNALQRQGENAGRCAELMAELTALREALKGVIRVADRDTAEFNAARDALSRVKGGCYKSTTKARIVM